MKNCNEPLSPLEESVREVLLQVTDLEVSENIVDLGLVYGIEIGKNITKVTLTLISSTYPMEASIWRFKEDVSVT
ncbi:MAG: iron-sulfur cluster assembly protein [Methylotenera sp.]|nr:iron-sulfur cluster assembly protein [Methylotenera sp.]